MYTNLHFITKHKDRRTFQCLGFRQFQQLIEIWRLEKAMTQTEIVYTSCA